VGPRGRRVARGAKECRTKARGGKKGKGDGGEAGRGDEKREKRGGRRVEEPWVEEKGALAKRSGRLSAPGA